MEMKYPIPEEVFNIPSISTERNFFIRISRIDTETMKLSVIEFRKGNQNILYETTWKETLVKVGDGDNK
jgi:hypothetical protein